MDTTTDSSLGITPCSTSATVAASVVPPAGSVKNPLGSGEQLNRSQDLVVRDHGAPPAGGPNGLQHLKPVGRISDGDRLRDGLWLYRLGILQPVVQGPNHWSRSGRLRGVNLRQLPFNQAELAELPEAAANPRE